MSSLCFGIWIKICVKICCFRRKAEREVIAAHWLAGRLSSALMFHARDHGHAARKSQHNVSRIGNGLPGPHPIPLRPSERVSAADFCDRESDRCTGGSAMHRSISRIAFLSGPSLSLSTVLWEGGQMGLPSPSLSFPSPIYLLAPHPNPQIDVTSRSFSVDRPNLLFRD